MEFTIEVTDDELNSILKKRKQEAKIKAIKNLWNQFTEDLQALGGDIYPSSVKTGYRTSGKLNVQGVRIDSFGNIELRF